jgi:predicted nucleic acid-binding protein
VARYALDTSLYIAADRHIKRAEDLERFTTAYLPSIHLHAVVVQELLAGAIDKSREQLVEESLISPFERRGRIVTPSFSAWKEAGQILSRLIQKRVLSPGGFKRSFLNDCLLAASCREDGITLITTNRVDFELIRKVHPFEFVEPWPVLEN